MEVLNQVERVTRSVRAGQERPVADGRCVDVLPFGDDVPDGVRVVGELVDRLVAGQQAVGDDRPGRRVDEEHFGTLGGEEVDVEADDDELVFLDGPSGLDTFTVLVEDFEAGDAWLLDDDSVATALTVVGVDAGVLLA